MKLKLSIVCICVSLAITSCDHSQLNGKDYVAYVEGKDHGLNNTKQLEGLEYSLQYCPQEYLLLKEYKTYNLSKKLIDLKKQQSDSLLYFKLRIKDMKGHGDVLNYNLNSNEAYYTRIEFLSYGFEENIVLVNNTDTLYPALYHFERTYGVAPYADFLIAFNSRRFLNQDISVIIDDRVFNNGLLKFNYKKDDIDHLPKLKAN